ncbi:MAG: glycosyltransferase family 39 protein [Actinomycetota bacterium]
MATAAPTQHGHEDRTPPWRWRGPLLGLGAIALVGGLALRVYAPSPLWLDEALSVEIASRGFDGIVDALRNDGHPALYYVLLGWWMDVFGDSNAAARSLSGVASLATVPVLWAIGRRHSPAIGGAAALLALGSPYLLRYGTEARMYALLVFVVSLAWLALERALDEPSIRRLAALAAATALVVHTHYWTFWLAGATVLVLVGTAWRDPARRSTIARVIAGLAAGGATFLVWIGVFFDQLGSTGTPWADRARPAEIVVETWQALGGNNRFEGEILGVVLFFVIVLGTIGHRVGTSVELRVTASPVTGPALVAVSTLAIGGVVALVTAGAFEGRYGAVVVPFCIVLAARGISLIPGAVGIALLAGIVVFGLGVGVDEARRDRSQGADVADAIDADAEAGDVAVFCPDQLGPATHRELDATIETIAYPRGDGRLVDWSDYADVIAAASPEDFHASVVDAADGNDIWFVGGFGYRSLGNRCEQLVNLFGRSHVPRQIIAPSTVFEPMLLIRFEPVR